MEIPRTIDALMDALKAPLLNPNVEELMRALCANLNPSAGSSTIFIRHSAVITDLVNIYSAYSAVDVKKDKSYPLEVTKVHVKGPTDRFMKVNFKQTSPTKIRNFSHLTQYCGNSVFLLTSEAGLRHIAIFKRKQNMLCVSPDIPKKSKKISAFPLGNVRVSSFHLEDTDNEHRVLKSTIAQQAAFPLEQPSLPATIPVALAPDVAAWLSTSRLDPEQRRVISAYLQMSTGMGSVLGPFGSGKSTTLSRLAILLLRQPDHTFNPRRLLISAHSNRAILRSAETLASLYVPEGASHDRSLWALPTGGEDLRFANPWMLSVVGHPSKLRIHKGDPLMKFSLDIKANAVAFAFTAAHVARALLPAMLSEGKESPELWKEFFEEVADTKFIRSFLRHTTADTSSPEWFRGCASFILHELIVPAVAELEFAGIDKYSTAKLVACPRFLQMAKSKGSALEEIVPRIQSVLAFLLLVHDSGLLAFAVQTKKKIPASVQAEVKTYWESKNMDKLRITIRPMSDEKLAALTAQPDKVVSSLKGQLVQTPTIKQRDLKSAFLCAASVVCATSTAYVTLDGPACIEHSSFSDVFVDEAGQIMEPSCRIPLRKAERGLLIGDPKQLPPFFSVSQDSSIPNRKVLMRSMLQRMDDAHRCWPAGAVTGGEQGRMMKLKVQYRVFPLLATFISQQVYGGVVTNGPNVLDHEARLEKHLGAGLASLVGGLRLANPKNIGPTLLQKGVVDLLKNNPGGVKVTGGSRVNLEEAVVAVTLLYSVLTTLDLSDPSTASLPTFSVKIVTPYRAQATLLEGLLAEILTFAEEYNVKAAAERGIVIDLKSIANPSTRRRRELQKHFALPKSGRKIEIDVRTIDGMQGDESDILIFSPVHLGEFANDNARTNVALTRARMGLVVVSQYVGTDAFDFTQPGACDSGVDLNGLLCRFFKFANEKGVAVPGKTFRHSHGPTVEQIQHHLAFV